VMMGVRPEDLELTTVSDGAAFSVRVVEPLGPHVLLTGEILAQQVRVTMPPDCLARGGDILYLRPLPGRIRWMSVPHGQALGMTA
jgi:multiple sugar transport system ATP-binding protein